MGKGIILLFLSEYRSDNEPLNYEVEDIREQGRTFEGQILTPQCSRQWG